MRVALRFVKVNDAKKVMDADGDANVALCSLEGDFDFDSVAFRVADAVGCIVGDTVVEAAFVSVKDKVGVLDGVADTVSVAALVMLLDRVLSCVGDVVPDASDDGDSEAVRLPDSVRVGLLVLSREKEAVSEAVTSTVGDVETVSDGVSVWLTLSSVSVLEPSTVALGVNVSDLLAVMVALSVLLAEASLVCVWLSLVVLDAVGSAVGVGVAVLVGSGVSVSVAGSVGDSVCDLGEVGVAVALIELDGVAFTDALGVAEAVTSDVGVSDTVFEPDTVSDSDTSLDGLGLVTVRELVGVTVREFQSV